MRGERALKAGIADPRAHVAYQYLDLVPKGRDEQDRGPYWIKRRDEYGDAGAPCCH